MLLYAETLFLLDGIQFYTLFLFNVHFYGNVFPEINLILSYLILSYLIILAVNWLMTTIVLKFQEIIDFFQEHRNPAGALKVSIVSPEISCSKVMLGC
jgi:hypothetical protein